MKDITKTKTWTMFEKAINIIIVLIIILVIWGAFLIITQKSDNPPPELSRVHFLIKDDIVKKEAKEKFLFLAEKCPYLFKTVKDYIREINVKNIDLEAVNSHHLYNDYGWRGAIEVTVKLGDTLPWPIDNIGANGHTLYFYVGNKSIYKQIISTKDIARKICGWETTENNESIVHEF